jgi:DNA-binding NarL/FixJ family response regulator
MSSKLPKTISHNIELTIDADCQVEDLKIHERRKGNRMTKPAIISRLVEKSLQVAELVRQGKTNTALAEGVKEIYKA